MTDQKEQVNIVVREETPSPVDTGKRPRVPGLSRRDKLLIAVAGVLLVLLLVLLLKDRFGGKDPVKPDPPSPDPDPIVVDDGDAVIGIDSAAVEGMDCEEVVKLLRDKGFTDITLTAVTDLGYETRDRDNTVYKVNVAGHSTFGARDVFPKNSQINVIYHQVKTSLIPDWSPGIDYVDYTGALKAAGFINVDVIAEEDLEYEDAELEKSVKSVLVGGTEEAVPGDKVAYDAPIIVRYHMLRPLFLPFDSNAAVQLTFDEVKARLEQAGFVNIVPDPVYDVVLGLLVKNGSIDEITVGGISTFSSNTPYRADVEIVIKYHASVWSKGN